MELSVIVPVYNAEKYLKQNIEMLLGQNYKDIEIILVNDGSKDKSESICLEYSNRYSNVKYLCKQNEGPSSARNAGIEVAEGEYLAFCDADDRIDSQMYERLMESVINHNADVVLCNFYSERDHNVGDMPWEDHECLSREKIIHELIPSMIGNTSDEEKGIPFWGSVCRGVYKSDIVKKNNIKFPQEIKFAEDMVFSLKFYQYAQKVIILNAAYYYYTYNPVSLMNSHVKYRPEMFETRLAVLENMKNVLEYLQIYELYKERIAVTARAYFYETIGNACREIGKRGEKTVIEELEGILFHPKVREAFSSIKFHFSKKSIFYCLIKKGKTRMLYGYYKFRFGGK